MFSVLFVQHRHPSDDLILLLLLQNYNQSVFVKGLWLDRVQHYSQIHKYHEYLKKEFIEKYMKKLYILELELKKVHVMELTDEIEEERGKSR